MIIKYNKSSLRRMLCHTAKTESFHIRPSCWFKSSSTTRMLQRLRSNADRAYNTLHFASQSHAPNGGFAPLGTPILSTSSSWEIPFLFLNCWILSARFTAASMLKRCKSWSSVFSLIITDRTYRSHQHTLEICQSSRIFCQPRWFFFFLDFLINSLESPSMM